ncbi:hypothetical protein CPAST_c15010 [Clostridium pasteurianum DSM 525 = ATCC 6013]|uniref:DUF488 domain-containing protein n=1 Tax=Clostridium pasteurianum DSM 525 = ATCC 6013 TaxID=1262449 RepID=A0A0H3J138_CLOPA|nr:DUF488 domain-containing protein [Clostridium pasteurianum]AJA47576.1 hypothetical protein CPAST_c15010 [Clostridium pasteurianum DSM 525 = ATCC 6013]AJA51564.1 hypothetical protein CLPA_c15010 [Clostridium pasteurianum DSM 525 = ATCC 6013]AOZ74891.1 hypothetical protein AQ983_07255 [Clostridium pasteurianum DSM 525 = ATCC 6013]AOZ78686.1 hypothetical protein AQ984_07245 [Clostridium pasteurianum]ELP58083.1 hypothetical protein F502_16590 [Clostridium pasteurianum DSM 525 = ATCC 6013]
MGNLCYTVGYSNRKLEDFIKLLSDYKINCIVDVRSIPHSNYEGAAVYNRDNIKKILNKQGIYYIYMGKELGARNEECIDEKGEISYESIRKNHSYKRGIERLMHGIEKGYNIAMMCVEKDPVNCHRAILIAHDLKKRNIYVKHILEENLVKSQGDIEEEIMDIYRVQLIKKVAQFSINSIMNNVDLDMDENDFKVEMLEEAYRMRGRDINHK